MATCRLGTSLLCISALLLLGGEIHGQDYGSSVPSAVGLSCDGKGSSAHNVSSYTPLFSWTFVDADSGDAQTAYAIRVGTTPGSGNMWDSGEQVSATSTRMYAGSALAPNVTYYWSVQVWDRAGQPSTAASASFAILDIGLRGFDGTSVVRFAADDNYSGYPVRIAKGSVVYGIVTVDPSAHGASKFRVWTGTQAKSLKAMVAPGPAIGISTCNVSFSGYQGGTDPAAQTVAVSNAGGGALGGLTATVTYDAGSGWLAAALDATTAPATLTLAPTIGSLDVGTYTARVTIASAVAGNSPQTVNVSFGVAEGNPAPVFSLAGGTYTGAQTVTITTSNARAGICYTTDGSTPTGAHGTHYAGPITVARSQTIRAVTVNGKAGTPISAVVSETYVIQYTAPVIVSAVAGSGQVTVIWGDVVGATSYHLYWAAGGTVTPATGTRIDCVGTSWLETGLTNGNQYAFIVVAVFAWGESAPSPVATATPHVQWSPVGVSGFSSGAAKEVALAVVTSGLNPGPGGGTPYVAYVDDANADKVTVVRFDGASWVPVGTPGFSAGAAACVSLVVTGGEIFVAYQDYAAGQRATVMVNNGSSWATLGLAGFSAGKASCLRLATDSAGTPYVAYVDEGNANRATVMKYAGGAWSAVGSAGFSAGTAGSMSLALYNDIPYVVFQDGTNGEATVMRYAGGSWQIVGNPGFSDSGGGFDGATLMFDAGGVPYVMWRMAWVSPGGGGRDNVVSRFDGANWQTAAVFRTLLWGGTFTMDAGGSFYIAYDDWWASGEIVLSRPLSVVTYDGTGWNQVGTPQFSDGIAGSVQIAIDPSGGVATPIVAFVDSANYFKVTVMTYK